MYLKHGDFVYHPPLKLHTEDFQSFASPPYGVDFSILE